VGITMDLKTIAPFTTIAFVIALIRMRKDGRSAGYLLCLSLFYVYILYVIKYTMFPLRLFSPWYTQLMIESGVTWRQGLNFIPLSFISGPLGPLSQQVIENVIMTIPFGFGLPFLVTTDLKSIITRGFIFSFSIEFIQLLLNITYGYRVRVVDVDDIILNVLGVAIGFGLFHLLSRLYLKTLSETEGIEGMGIWAHMHSVLSGATIKRQPE
jgi:glycopeptide antibiotics resistance protein